LIPLLLASLLVNKAAIAHPHVWVDYAATLVFDHGKMMAIRQHWTFDEDFSSMVASDILRAHWPRKLSADDVTALRQNAFDNLRAYGYFTHAWADGKPLDLGSVQSFDAHADGAKLIYDITIGFARPLDPRDSAVALGIWDDTYYVDMEPVKDRPVAMTGEGSSGCSATIFEDQTHPIYFGSVNPLGIKIACRDRP
jgi:ABC-type uncharacterized transport system substrate-binding protein